MQTSFADARRGSYCIEDPTAIPMIEKLLHVVHVLNSCWLRAPHPPERGTQPANRPASQPASSQPAVNKQPATNTVPGATGRSISPAVHGGWVAVRTAQAPPSLACRHCSHHSRCICILADCDALLVMPSSDGSLRPRQFGSTDGRTPVIPPLSWGC